MTSEEIKRYLIYLAVFVGIVGAGYLYGRNTATDDYRATVEQLRSELLAAAGINRDLKADNDRLGKFNSQLAGEITASRLEVTESRRLADTIGDYNRENAGRLDEAGNIVADCQRISGEIRKGNPVKN